MSAELATTAPVLITGVSGFVGSHTMVQLLAAGYRVRGTVRSDPAAAKYDFVRAAAGEHADRLEMVEASLSDEGSYDAAAEGCEVVMHIASPYALTVQDPQAELVDPARNGTLNVLRACTKSSTTRHIIVASSLAAVSDEFINGKVYTEEDWNETSNLNRNPYYFSKAVAERAAHEYVAETDPNLTLSVINPFVVLGPAFNDTINESVGLYVTLLNGGMRTGHPNLSFGLVDVRDVALAHIRAMEHPESTGRHLLCHGPHSLAELVATLKEMYPAYPLPCMQAPSAVVRLAARFETRGVRQFLATNLDHVPTIDTTKAQTNLHIEYRPLEETLKDMCDDLIKRGAVRERTGSGGCVIC